MATASPLPTPSERQPARAAARRRVQLGIGEHAPARPPRPDGRGGRAPRRSATRPAQLSYGAMPSGDWTEEQAARRIRPAAEWQPAGDYEDIRYETADGIAKITIDRPEVRNAFRPQTVVELSGALERAREDTEVGVVVLTGEGPLAFCSGRRPARARRLRLPGRRRVGTERHRPLPRDRPARPDAPPAEAARGHGGRVRDRRRPRAARALRPHDRGRQRALRPDRARRSAASTAASAPACSPARWARRRPRRSGSSAASTTQARRERWAS